jgi:hypothetical protein
MADAERDQQKWAPVLRSIARQQIDLAQDLVGEPLTLRRSCANENGLPFGAARFGNTG